MALDHPGLQTAAVGSLIPAVTHFDGWTLLLAIPAAIYYALLSIQFLYEAGKKRGKKDEQTHPTSPD